jgi:uncharacterized protein (TIRG00374 family)
MDASRRHAVWGIASWLVGLGAIVAVVVFSARLGKTQELAHLIRTMRPEWVAVATGLQALTYACDATIWMRVLARAGTPQPFGRMYGLSIARQFARQAIPSAGLSGDALLVRALSKYGVQLEASMTALVLNLFAFYASFATCAVAATVVFSAADAVRRSLMVVAIPFAVLVIAIPALLAWLVRTGGGRRRTWWRRVPILKHVLGAFGKARVDLLKDRTLVAQVVSLQLLTWACDAGTLVALLAGLGVDAPVIGGFAAFILASAAELVGPMPGGLGAFEGGCILGLRAFGVPVETALLATLVLRGFTFWLPMLPGIFVARWAMVPSQAPGRK